MTLSKTFRRGDIVRFGNLPTAGHVIQGNSLFSLVSWHDGDTCEVATEALSLA